MPKSQPRGFTLIELLITLSIMGVLLMIGMPRVRTALAKSQARAARTSIMTLYNGARARAVREGRSMTLHVNSGGSAWVTAWPRRTAGSGTCDTIVPVRNLASVYGVTITAAPDSFRVDARGLGQQAFTDSTQIIITRSGAIRF